MIWLNDGLAQDGQGIPPRDRGMSLGDGLFETLLVQKGVACYLDEHLARMKQAADLIGLAFPEQRMRKAVAVMLAQDQSDTGVMRITLTRGVGGRGLSPTDSGVPTLLITLDPYQMELGPVSCLIAMERRFSGSLLSRIKSLSYLPQIMAQREAKRAYRDEALMLNEKDHLVCAARANLFIWHDNRLVTPPISDGAFPGIVRARIFLIARQLGWNCEERTITPGELKGASEAFLTNSLFLIRPIGGRAAERASILWDHLGREIAT